MVVEMIRTLIVNVDYDRWYSPAKFGKDCGLSNEDVKAFSNACLQEAGEAVRWNVDGIQIQRCDLYSAILRWSRSPGTAGQYRVDERDESSPDQTILDFVPLYCHIWSTLLKQEAKSSSSKEVSR